MKRILKLLLYASVFTLLTFFLCYTVMAEETSLSEEILAASGADELQNDMPSDVRAIMERYGIEAGSTDPSEKFGFGEALEYFLDAVKDNITQPMSVLFTFTAAIALASFMQGMDGGLKGGIDKMTGYVAVIAGAGASLPLICGCFLRTRETVLQCTDFMTAFTPVFAGIVITSGNPAAGLGCYTTIYALVNIIMQVMGSVFLPMLSMCLALSIADGVSDKMSMGGIIRFLKTLVTWSLGLIMTLFLGMLSIQGVVRGAGDSFGTKTARYVVSNFVPFVGGAVSDAYGTVLSCMKILRSSTGFVGVAALCILFLPVLAELVLYRFAVGAAAAVSDLFAVPSLGKMLRGIELTLQMTIAVFVCFFVMFIVAIAMVMVITGSTG